MEEGLSWSQEALKREKMHSENLLSRCNLYIGIGAQCMALTSFLKSVKDKYHALCLESLTKYYFFKFEFILLFF
jgi:tetratricopeptide repeat protein 7